MHTLPLRSLLFPGDVVYLDALGDPMIILGSHEAAIELLDTRSANYSSRVQSVMAQMYVPISARGLATQTARCFEYCSAGWEWTFTLMPYGPVWRRRRKEMHQFFHPNAVVQYQPLQQREAAKFLKKLLTKPDTFLHQVRQCASSSIALHCLTSS